MPPFQTPRLLLAVVLFIASTRPFACAHLFSWLVDWQTVCEPDFIQCPNGGLTFRDRKHGCEFTPCELIPNPPLPPARPDPKTLPVSNWFGRYEFVVPTFNAVALKRGKTVELEWTQAIVAKRGQQSRAHFTATIDLYVVNESPPNVSEPSAHAHHTQKLHLDALLASQAELFAEEDNGSAAAASSQSGSHEFSFSSTERDLAVSSSPWTRWEFFGHFGASVIPPTLMTVQTALRLLTNATITDQSPTKSLGSTNFSAVVIQATEETDIMAELLSKCDVLTETTRRVALTSAKRNSSVQSVLVFTTDFRSAVDLQASSISVEMLKPWNVTRIQCDQATLHKAIASIGTNPFNAIPSSDATTHLLWRPNHTHPSDAGYDPQRNRGNNTNCSCWIRSLVGLSDHSTKWMLCQ